MIKCCFLLKWQSVGQEIDALEQEIDALEQEIDALELVPSSRMAKNVPNKESMNDMPTYDERCEPLSQGFYVFFAHTEAWKRKNELKVSSSPPVLVSTEPPVKLRKVIFEIHVYRFNPLNLDY